MLVVPTDSPIVSKQRLTGLEICIERFKKLFDNSIKNMSHSLCFIIRMVRFLLTFVSRNLEIFFYCISLFSKTCFPIPHSLRGTSQFKLRKMGAIA